jgi:hypothetical protein
LLSDLAQSFFEMEEHMELVLQDGRLRAISFLEAGMAKRLPRKPSGIWRFRESVQFLVLPGIMRRSWCRWVFRPWDFSRRGE